MLTRRLGANCGWNAIDKNFNHWLAQALGDQNYQFLDHETLTGNNSRLTDPSKLKLFMSEFKALRRRFSERYRRSEHAYQLDLPEPLQHLNVEEVVEDGVLLTERYIIPPPSLAHC
jgi:hypothetical protein